DDDWSSVNLGLVSGRPISFQMDLYQPLFVPRPVVEPELFASLRPPVYSGNLEADRWDKAKADGKAQTRSAAAPPAPGLANAGPGGGRGEAKQALEMLKKNEGGVHFNKDIATSAATTELGEYFQYIIKQPVSLPRQKSALLPIIN